MQKKTVSFNLSTYLIAGLFAAITFLLSYFNNLLPFEQLLYDRMLRLQFDEPNQEVVIVAMDEKSLQAYGALPWSRKVHAELIDVLTEADVKAVGYDVLFDKKKDQLDEVLVKAVKNNGKMIFPVIIEKMSQSGELIEIMPYPELIQVTKKLGLVHFELGDDNIARSTYLNAGLGQPFWKSFAAEVLKVASDETFEFPFPETEKEPSYDLTKIEKENLVYLPFKQEAEHFNRVSFVDIVNRVPEALASINNKVVFVGVTATAARNADFLPVPVDRDGQIMSGVEINATLYEALQNKTYIQEVPVLINALVLALVSFIYFVFLPKSLPARSFYYGLLLILTIVVLAWFALHYWNSWFRVATLLSVLITGYLLWLWQKMVANMSFFKRTVERLSFEMKHSMRPDQELNVSRKLKFLTKIGLLDIQKIEKAPKFSPEMSPSMQDFITNLERDDASKKDRKLLNKLLSVNSESDELTKATSDGVIERRIKSLDSAIQQMNFLRRFIEQTMDRMSDGVILTDSDGYVFYSNLVAKRYLPQLSQSSSVELLDLLNSVKLQNNEDWTPYVRKVLADGVNSELTATIDNSLDVKVSMSLLDNVNGKSYLIINIVDISAIKREQRRQLEMIDFISHDLRSPMTSILALTSREQRVSDGSEANEVYQKIEKLTRSSLSLAEQFLMLSRTEANIELAIYPVELLNAIDNAIAIVTPQANQNKIAIHFDYLAYEDIWLNTNQDLLERVITNLISNAVKYSPEETKVVIEIEKTDSSTLLKVIDQGDGISSEQMEAIFKPFTRMQKHEMEKVKGIGLGLRFVRAAMNRFGGSVAVESNKSKGSTFILDFPDKLLSEDY